MELLAFLFAMRPPAQPCLRDGKLQHYGYGI